MARAFVSARGVVARLGVGVLSLSSSERVNGNAAGNVINP